MFRSTTIIKELAIEPNLSYIDIKTFSKVMSLFLSTAHSTHAILGHAATPPNKK